MIINNVTEPKKSLYVIGANIVNIINVSKLDSIDPIELYKIYINKINSISITYFYLSLDWLYMIELIDVNHVGNIKLCN
ncbi:ABC-three component system middle component 6 [Vibrio sinaloensis]|uniref:ABC-three component system middle component 6 n=1 Tax=Photobacterium sp. (strain ATCC 43367) TaxID=379097 RepID=UPI00388ABF76